MEKTLGYLELCTRLHAEGVAEVTIDGALIALSLTGIERFPAECSEDQYVAVGKYLAGFVKSCEDGPGARVSHAN